MTAVMELPRALWAKLLRGESTVAPASETDAERAWPWLVMFLGASVFLCVNIGLIELLGKPIGRLLLGANVKPQKLAKFAQSFMEFIFYTAGALLGCAIVLEQSWVWPSTQWWVITPQIKDLGLEVRMYYVIYACRYLQAFVAVVFWETRRKDFLEMVIHHVVAVVLTVLSYYADYVRVGCIVMILLDVGDPPLHIAKMCKYVSEAKGPRSAVWSTLADIWFAIFAVVFTITRLGFFGYVCWSAQVEIYRVGAPGVPWPRSAVELGWKHVPCQLGLYTLLSLQCFWEVALLKVIYNVINGSELQDTRSDTDTDATKDKGD